MKGKSKWWILGIAVAIVVCGIAYTVVRSKEPQYIAPEGQGISAIASEIAVEELWEESEEKNKSANKIMVHVSGAVKNPNVYELDEGSRINDAVEMAGGVTEDADLNQVNLAAYISDAQKIVIPKIGEELQSESSGNKPTVEPSDGLIDLNTATKAELMTLDGIGDSISQAIIDYRDKNGGFKSTDEIKKVNRIGEKTFDKIKDKIIVR